MKSEERAGPTGASGDEVRHASRVLTREELTRHLLALVLTAVLVWNTVLIPPNAYAPAKRPRRRSRGGAERAGEARRAVSATPQPADVWPEEQACESVDDLDWPEFIGLE